MKLVVILCVSVLTLACVTALLSEDDTVNEQAERAVLEESVKRAAESFQSVGPN